MTTSLSRCVSQKLARARCNYLRIPQAKQNETKNRISSDGFLTEAFPSICDDRETSLYLTCYKRFIYTNQIRELVILRRSFPARNFEIVFV